MKRDEVKELFGDSITKEQLDKLMSMHGNDVNGYKQQLSDANARAQELQGKVDEFDRQKAANLTAQEQLEQRMREMEAKAAETQRGYNRMQAAKAFTGLNIEEGALSGILDKVVTEDADATRQAAESIADVIRAQREDAVREAKKAAQASNPKPKGGSGGGEVTKEDFSKMSYSQKLQLKQDNPDLFKELHSN